MKIFYTDTFVLPLPEKHRFPMRKYALLRERVAATSLAGAALCLPPAATNAQLRRVHTAAYLERVVGGTLSASEVRRIGFPWSEGLVERSRRSTGATIAAAWSALEDGAGVNLAGGTHHAFADMGQGFCVFNDVAVAIRELQARGAIKRALIIDTDVHQGNGTAALLADDPSVFAFSMHGERNFPFHKQRSDLDVALPNGTGDREFLAGLERGLRAARSAGPFELAFYLAGADPYEGDRLGKLAVSKAGLRERDRRVFAECGHRGLPVVVVMGGGYAPNIDDIVDIHFNSVAAAARYAQIWKAQRAAS